MTHNLLPANLASMEMHRSSGVCGIILLLLLICCLAWLIRCLVSLCQIRPMDRQLLPQVGEMLRHDLRDEAEQLTSSDRSVTGRVLTVSIQRSAAGPRAAMDAMENSAAREITRIHRRLGLLKWLGYLGPPVGLIGTIDRVSSSLQTFASLVVPVPADLAMGTYESLVNLELGLGIAILVLPAHALVRDRSVLLFLRTRQEIASLLIQALPFRPTARRVRQRRTFAPPSCPPFPAGPDAGGVACAAIAAGGLSLVLHCLLIAGSDFSPREVEDLTLPTAVCIKENNSWYFVRPERITLNLFHVTEPSRNWCAKHGVLPLCRARGHWRIDIRGRDFTDPDRLRNILKREADLDRDPINSDFSNRTILIRADRAAPYGVVQAVVRMCAQAGIFKIEFGAARPGDPR